MLKTKTSLTLLGLLCTVSGAAQEANSSSATLALTMKEAIEAALSPQGSVAVQLAEESVRIAESYLQQSDAMRMPTVDGYLSPQNRSINLDAVGVRLNDDAEAAGITLPRSVGPFTTTDVRLRARYDLLNLGVKRAIQAASTQVSAAEADRDANRDEVGFQVASLYLLALRQKAKVDAAQANIARSKAMLTSAQHRDAAGVGTEIDITRMKSQLATDEYALSAAQIEQEIAELNLLSAMGKPLGIELRLVDSLDLAETSRQTAAEASEQARQGRSDLRAQEQRIERIKLDDRAIHSQRLPTIDVFGDVGAVNANADQPVATHTVGIALRVPVFDGGRRAARRAEVNARVRIEELRRKQLLDRLDLEVEQALRKLALTRKQVDVAQTGIELAEDELDRASRRYENGVTNNLEVVEAQTRLRQAQSNRIETLYSYNQSRVDLARAKGDIKSLIE